jgi:3-deoxy-D-manno-octulosonic acid (KDO) 8-phosphate synthase
MFFKETEKDPKCCKCDAINNIPLNSGMRFKEIPTRFDFEHMDRDSSLAYSMDPNVL